MKQVDVNYAWLYNENQYLYVELSDSVEHFMTFNSKAASVTRQLVPKSIVSHSFGSTDIRVPPYLVWAYLY